jgi:hypothetical protein
MTERKNNTHEGRSPDSNTNRNEERSSRKNDLPDTPADREKLEAEETYIDLPDVKDIPGQEFVNAPPVGMLGDTTISSDDEEGRSIFDREDSDELRATGDESDVTRDEKATLRNSDYMPTRDEDNLARARMDNTDLEGTRLNERGFGDERTGSDLDVPGAELDDRDEKSGEEDEENNDYSLGSDDNDASENRS